MSEKNETLADIVALIRAAANIQNADTPQSVLRLADRIEAAWRRERAEIEADALSVGGVVEAAHNKPSGNAAALREALSDACYAMFNFLKAQNGGYEEMANALDKAKAALAKPWRNCDKYTSLDEARNAYMAINELPEGNRDEDMRRWLCDFHNWLFAIAKEGGAK